MTIKEIEDYINTYRMYPEEYTGKRNKTLIRAMGSSYRYDTKNNTITRLEGRINDIGDFELIGTFIFPADNPEDKTLLPPDRLDMDFITRTYNQLVTGLGYEDCTIAPGTDRENWNLRDMVSEVEYIRSTYYDKSHANSKLKAEDLKEFNRRTGRLRHFLRTYKDDIGDLVAYTTHNSKYDN